MQPDECLEEELIGEFSGGAAEGAHGQRLLERRPHLGFVERGHPDERTVYLTGLERSLSCLDATWTVETVAVRARSCWDEKQGDDNPDG